MTLLPFLTGLPKLKNDIFFLLCHTQPTYQNYVSIIETAAFCPLRPLRAAFERVPKLIKFENVQT